MSLPPELDRTFAAIVFDWDGTAVPSRHDDARPLAERLEALGATGCRLVVVTGTNVRNVLGQLVFSRGSPPRGLYLCTNRGSEAYGFADGRPVLLERRVATPEEDHALNAAVEAAAAELRRRGLEVGIVYDRLNRRKVDLLPAPEWAEPPKARVAELEMEVRRRLRDRGIGGLGAALRIARTAAEQAGLRDARITTDVKHVEIGLTDKGDSARWVRERLGGVAGILERDVLVVGDELGPQGGVEGSDRRMADELPGATVVSVGVEPEGAPAGVIRIGGGPSRFLELLDAQLARRARQVPDLFEPMSPDPGWRLVEEGADLARERDIEALFASVNGLFGTRAALAERWIASMPGTLVAGLYDAAGDGLAATGLGADGGAAPRAGGAELVVVPDWTELRVVVGGRTLSLDRAGEVIEHRRVLDLSRGVLLRRLRLRDREGRVSELVELRFASLADRHLGVQRLRVHPENCAGPVAFEAVLDGRSRNADGTRHLDRVRAHAGDDVGAAELCASACTIDRCEGVAVASDVRLRSEECRPEADGTTEHRVEGERALAILSCEPELGGRRTIDRVAAVFTAPDTGDAESAALARVRAASQRGVDALLDDHSRAWRRLLEDADVEIDGDDEAQRAIRFGLYHLLTAANPDDPGVSIPARGLTGEGYHGHVFWDTEIYMLPFYALTLPRAARSLLLFRYAGLDGARDRARSRGRAGAQFPWESVGHGRDATPGEITLPNGVRVPLKVAEQELHVTADIAWAVWRYAVASGDVEFLENEGAALLFEIARFWASVAERGAGGRLHIRRVIGPDEYHVGVDDNAYTNHMAAFALERAAALHQRLSQRRSPSLDRLGAELRIDGGEAASWRRAAAAMADGIPAEGSLAEGGPIEQFSGYFTKVDVDLARFEPRTASLDVLLGLDRLQETQIVKQADVVLLLHLLSDRFPAPLQRRSFSYYERRCAHGSSLSPGIHAAVAARLGQRELALRYLHQTFAVDLSPAQGDAASGVHMGALGSAWQAIVHGFAGVWIDEQEIRLDPLLPPGWAALRFPLRVRGARLRVAIDARPDGRIELHLRIDDAATNAAPLVVRLGGRRVLLEPGRSYVSRGVPGALDALQEVAG